MKIDDRNLSKVHVPKCHDIIALAAIFYYFVGTSIVFCELINKNVLESFLLIICKGHIYVKADILHFRSS